MTAPSHPLRVLWVAGHPRACCCPAHWWRVIPTHGVLPDETPKQVAS